ncbi:MAG TPA: SGNH/GDSL hydrolase family protein [Gemmatimonadaceae bacterium]|nr:SGNH/GDSL hydrolase family protein [Gemmatimonadaceae bacterium]
MLRRSSLFRPLALLGTSLALAACTDPVQPTSPDAAVRRDVVTAPQLFARYVALGTSNSQGVQSAGLNASGQRAAWPAQLASRAGVPMSLPLVQDPGCSPPLLPPLAADAALLAAFSAFGAGGDLMSAVMTTCAPLQAGIVPPTNSVAISGADVHDALTSTIESEAAVGARVTELYRRVLAPGQTQVTAMLAEQPTFVSVELAANDVLPASTGRASAMTPYANWEADYDAVIGAVRSTGARAVLVGLPNNAANFPSIRRSREFFNNWPYLLTLGISVSLNCYYSSNYVFIPGYVLTLLSKTPTTATCADVPGAADYVITPSDMSAINARMAQINTHIQAQAAANGYAYFSLSALYDLPKPSLDMYKVLFSSTPFGSNMSLDGVHPNAAGQTILANAAAQAVNQTYGTAIP